MSEARLLGRFSSPVPYTIEGVAGAPRAGGVHVVADGRGEVVYVGRTGNLRDRLRQHLSGDRQASVLHEQVGAALDGPEHAASAQEIAAWLGRGTVRWWETDDAEDVKAQLVRELSPRFNRLAELPRTGVWWVNQGRTYEVEREMSIVFAGSAAPRVAHHLDVGRMVPGEVVLHYWRAQVVAIGEVVAAPVERRRPYPLHGQQDEGWLTRVEYFRLDEPIPLADLPARDGTEGPFARTGAAKQGYLFPLDLDWSDRLRRDFADRWPEGSPWALGERAFWIFQSSPDQWDLSVHLPDMPPGHVEDWTVTRNRNDMHPGDGVVLWQGGSGNDGIHVIGRLVGVPQAGPTPDFRPESAGPEEHRVDLVVERRVQPPISRDAARRDPVLAELAVLTRPWAGTNLRMTRGQWQAVWALAPLATERRPGPDWDQLVHWTARFAAEVDFDVEERQYKLKIRDRLTIARGMVLGGAPSWPGELRRAFGPPNNLTSWRMHGTFLDWADKEPDDVRAALLALWDEDRTVPDAIDSFTALLPVEVSGVGTRTNLASFLAGARGMEDHPVYRVRMLATAYRLTGWTPPAAPEPGLRYADALDFLDGYAEACRAAGIAPMRDRLDAQGALWQVLSGQAPPGWSVAEVQGYRRFLGGQQMGDLAELVEQFRAEVRYPEDGRPERAAQREELAAVLTPDALDEPDVRQLRRLAGVAYGSPGPQAGFYRLLQTEEGVGQVTGTLRFLLYGPGAVEERLNECLAGAHKLSGVAEALLVKALAVRDPDRWFPNYVTTGKVGKLAVLDELAEEPVAGSTPAAAAVETNDRLRERLEPYLPGDPWGMQEFGWWLLHRVRVPESSLAGLADELFLTEEFLTGIVDLLEDKGQVVLYGPPGTGKTYVARKLAGHIARGGGAVEKVQFHPSYAYEDFVEGYRPRLVDGQVTYEVVDGPLKEIAKTALERPDVTHVLLIDELNRANVAKVLGELLFLLEYRDEQIRLQYSDEPFALPGNLRIIATMNTADRSVALVDTALRRRFHFVPFFPSAAPIDGVLRRWLAANAPDLAWVADVVDRANRELGDRNAAIGPSHFLRDGGLTEKHVRMAWSHSVLPFLEEHYFADPEQLDRFDLDRLRSRAADEDSQRP